MSVVGDKVAVVSLGMSCQTAVQIRDHVSVIAASAGDATLRPSALPFDSIVCHPASAVKMPTSRVLVAGPVVLTSYFPSAAIVQVT